MTVAELRKELGLSKAAFSRLTGVPVNTIKDWENGWHQPKSWVMPMLELFARTQFERVESGEITLRPERPEK